MKPNRLRLLAITFATLLTGVAPHSALAFEMIEVRLVTEAPVGGPTLSLPGETATVEIEPAVLLSTSDFADVGDVTSVEGQPAFEVTLTPAGAEKLTQVSTENVGRSLAVIVGGELLMTPRIVDPITGDGFMLSMDNEAEARALAARLEAALRP